MNTNERIILTKKSLTGLSIGDGFGEQFFGEPDTIENALQNRIVPNGLWYFTDDTIMAIPLVKSLEIYGEIRQDFVAKQFAENYFLDMNRGYGPSMHRKLRQIDEGGDWLTISKASFGGQGSMGNGGAMRVAPIGAYFHDNKTKIVEEAIKSCEITHFHQEAKSGAIAVAIASGLCTRIGLGETISREAWLDEIIEFTPESDLKYKLIKIKTLPKSYHIKTIVSALGNGVKMTAQDTVPMVIWNAYHELYDFEAALWRTVSALGDRDTTCAMVGGMTLLSARDETVPNEWKVKVEDWKQSMFYQKE